MGVWEDIRDLLNPRRVEISKPIESASWNLQESIKGVSLEMDREGNVKGMPVVVIDTTKPSSVPASASYIPGSIITGTAQPQDVTYQTLHDCTKTDTYVLGFLIDYAAAFMITGPAEVDLVFFDGNNTIKLIHRWYVDITPAFHTSLVITFGVPYAFPRAVKVAITGGPLNLPMFVTMWGYDA